MEEDYMLAEAIYLAQTHIPSKPSVSEPRMDLALSIEIEEDCRVNNDVHFFQQENTFNYANDSDLFVRPKLYVTQLSEIYFAVFNPFSNRGVLILTLEQMQLLDTFREPRPLPKSVFNIEELKDNNLHELDYLFGLGLLQHADEESKLRANQPQTLTAWLHITNDCNLRCDYCYVYKTPSKMEMDRGKQAIRAIFRSAVAHSFRDVKLKYAGGEATLNFQLVLTLHAYAQTLADKHGLSLDGVLLSNGIAISDRMIQDMQTHNIRLMISLDGVGEAHDAQRRFVNGRSSFAQVERTLNRLAAHEFVPSIAITVSNRNLHGLPDLVSYLLQRQLPFSINFFRENDCAESFTDLTYQEDAIIAAMRAAFAEIEKSLPPYSLLGSLIDRVRLNAPHNRTCGVGQSYLVIDQHGRVAKCHMEIEQTLADVSANNPLALVMADKSGIQNLAVEEKKGCRDCTWRYWCAGGCPALTYRTTGRFDVKSPNCNIYKALFPEVIRLEGLRLLKYGASSS